MGSNIFNLSAVLGGSLLFSGPIAFQAFQVDLWVMLISAALCAPFFYSGKRVGRLEGGVLLGFYIGYFAWILMNLPENG